MLTSFISFLNGVYKYCSGGLCEILFFFFEY